MAAAAPTSASASTSSLTTTVVSAPSAPAAVSKATGLGEQLGTAVAIGLVSVMEFDEKHKIHETAVDLVMTGVHKVQELDHKYEISKKCEAMARAGGEFVVAAAGTLLQSIKGGVPLATSTTTSTTLVPAPTTTPSPAVVAVQS